MCKNIGTLSKTLPQLLNYFSLDLKSGHCQNIPPHISRARCAEYLNQWKIWLGVFLASYGFLSFVLLALKKMELILDCHFS